MDEQEVFTCVSCGRRYYQRDIFFFNDKPVCDNCFRKIPEDKKKNMTCRVRGCKNRRREDLGSEYCDFHLNERFFEEDEMLKELEEYRR